MRQGKALMRVTWALALAAGMAAGAAWAFDPDAPGQGMIPVPAPTPPAPGAPTPPVPGAQGVAPAPGMPALPNGALPAATPEPVIAAKPVSMFITPEEMAKINDAIAAYKRMRENRNSNAENQAKNFLNQLEEPAKELVAEPPKPQVFTYPQFFLQTLSYQGPDDWMVMVNGQKFVPRYDDPNSPLKVVMVTQEMVVIEWRPQDMEKVSQAWMMASSGPGQSDVVVDSIRSTVTFTLKPNQTFSSYAMRVVEGKVVPVTVMVQPSTPFQSFGAKPPTARPAARPTVAAPAPATTPPPAPVAVDEKDGAKGLSDTYKKMGLE